MYAQNIIYSLTISVVVLLGWIRFKKMDRVFMPFIFLVSAGLINELLSLLLITSGHQNTINYNLYTLLESLLIVWQLRTWGLFNNKGVIFYSLQTSLLIGWSLENFFQTLFRFNSLFIIIYSFLVVLLSIVMMNRLIVSYRGHLFKNAAFLICVGFIFYFSFSLLTETFWLAGLGQSSSFRISIQSMLTYVNLIVNLLFILAIIWIPMKRQYILRSLSAG